MFTFYKECIIKVENEKTILPKPLVFYEGDLFTVRFVMKNLDFYKEQITKIAEDITDKTYADFFVFQPDGNSLTVKNTFKVDTTKLDLDSSTGEITTMGKIETSNNIKGNEITGNKVFGAVWM